MPGTRKEYRQRSGHGRAFPASQYNDPRGGRPSALERNILRYRAIEASLYLFYADEVRTFMTTNVCPPEPGQTDITPWASLEENRLERVLSEILSDAQSSNKLLPEDARSLRLAFSEERDQGKQLKSAFAHSIKIGMFTKEEASEVQGLLKYRNDIAHRIHLVMSDVSRTHAAIDFIALTAPTYKGEALDKLRVYRASLSERARRCLHSLCISMDGLLFEFAEQVYESDLTRLDKLIRAQIRQEQTRVNAINAELDLRGTELVDDLSPRHPKNHRCRNYYGDDYLPPTGHLTKRGVEICYRLFDMGKQPIAVAYLMGMGLRAAEKRRKSWLRAGGLQRVRSEVKRYRMPDRQTTN